ncbi:hypothetical protein D3C84_104010 [compost metagenome]
MFSLFDYRVEAAGDHPIIAFRVAPTQHLAVVDNLPPHFLCNVVGSIPHPHAPITACMLSCVGHGQLNAGENYGQLFLGHAVYLFGWDWGYLTVIIVGRQQLKHFSLDKEKGAKRPLPSLDELNALCFGRSLIQGDALVQNFQFSDMLITLTGSILPQGLDFLYSLGHL